MRIYAWDMDGGDSGNATSVMPSLWQRRLWAKRWIRIGSHVALSLDSYVRTRKVRWLVAGGVAMAADVWVSSANVSEQGREIIPLGVSVLDAALWSSQEQIAGTAVRQIVLADVVPDAIVAGFRFAAGTNAVPIVDPMRPFPPSGPAVRRWVRPGIDLLLPAVVPLTMAVVRKKRRNASTTERGYRYGVAAAVGGIVLGRLRDRMQRDARANWDRRTLVHEQVQREAAEARLAVDLASGHDFKKVLSALGYWGSERARVAGMEQGERPARTFDRMNGKMLRHATYGVPVEPLDMWTWWLSDAQVDELQAFLDVAEDSPRGARAVLRAEVVSNDQLRLSYLGHVHLITPMAMPALRAGLVPLPAIAATSLAWHLEPLSEHVGGLRWPAVLAAVALDTFSVGRSIRTPLGPFEPPTTALVLSGCATAIELLAVAAGWSHLESSDGTATFSETSVINAFLALLLTHWSRLEHRRPLLAASLGAWFATALISGQRNVVRLCIELVNIAQTMLGVLDLASIADLETQALDHDLRLEYDRRVKAAYQAAERTELKHYRHQLTIAQEELAELGDRVPPESARAMAANCAIMKEWLDRPDNPLQLAY